jgi:hypothetical protein
LVAADGDNEAFADYVAEHADLWNAEDEGIGRSS